MGDGMYKLVDNDTLLGVEIEVEQSNKMMAHTPLRKYWEVVGDGSLRLNGAELVFNRPYNGAEALDALMRAEVATRNCLYSDRCGLHVHVDMRGVASPVLYEFIIAYLLFEPLLLGFCGKERENNNFCVPMGTNKAFLREVASRRGMSDLVARMSRRDHRYAALNLMAYTQHGSFEFRSMRGTASREVLVPWINMLLSIRKYAHTIPDTLSTVERCSTDVADMLLREVFDEDLVTLLVEANGGDVAQKMLEGARAVQYVLRCREAENVTMKLLGHVAAPIKRRGVANLNQEIVIDAFAAMPADPE